MQVSNIAKGLCGIAAIVMVASPFVTEAKPRRISVGSDGTATTVSDTSTTTTTTSTSSGTTSTSTASAGTSTWTSGAIDNKYYPTVNPTLTPAEMSFAGRRWRTNMGASWIADMPHSLRISSTGSRVRFEVRNTANDRSINDTADKRRAELSGSLLGDSTRLPNGQSLWGAFSTIHAPWADPVGMSKLTGGVYGQIHMGSFGGSPAVAFRRRQDGTFRITTRGEFNTAGTVRYQAPLTWGEPHDIVYNLVLHPTAGSLRVWVDGQQVVNVANVSIGSSKGGSYWAFGAYFAGGVTSPVVAEYANHVYPSTNSLSGRVTSRPAWPTS